MLDAAGNLNIGAILAIAAIVAGLVLLGVYVVGRGLHTRELDGTDDAAAALAADDPTAERAPRPAPRSRSGRPIGALGALLLVVGLGLGALTLTSGSGTSGPGAVPSDCLAGWNGCGVTTPKP